jgi:RNA polymerase sigma-70 factor (ECF subfamily)
VTDRKSHTGDASDAAAVRTGDADAFATLCEPYRRRLHVHCYRLLGSFGEAEDLVQETFLRAWRARETYAGRASFATWLYRIATNACLNVLERAPRRVLPPDVAAPVIAGFAAENARPTPPVANEIPWLEPYPDHLLEPTAAPASEPEAQLASRETIGLAFLTALQSLPPRQRAVLILCDVLGWSAQEAAAQLELSLAAVTSALQRAHTTVRAQPTFDPEGLAVTKPETPRERELLHGFMAAVTGSDTALLVRLLSEDARWAMPPAPLWFDGRAAIAQLLQLYPFSRNGSFKAVATAANRQPAAAVYLRRPDQTEHHFAGVHVLRVDGGAIREITTFGATLCAAFGLPATL